RGKHLVFLTLLSELVSQRHRLSPVAPHQPLELAKGHRPHARTGGRYVKTMQWCNPHVPAATAGIEGPWPLRAPREGFHLSVAMRAHGPSLPPGNASICR
ncbi:unnamed protein product, partial [Musa textilis]